MVGKKEKTVVNIIKNKIIKTSINLEEYIPLKVLIDREDEPVKNVSYSKDKTSFLEITVGIASGFIKRITLLLSKEYSINRNKINITTYEIGDLILRGESKNNCSYFKTNLYENGIRIIISEEKILKYVKMDRIYIGLSNQGCIVEICIYQLTSSEINHIKNELDYQ